jgi:hypothetical protein
MNSVRNADAGHDLQVRLAEHKCATWQDHHGITLTHVNMYVYVIAEDMTMETIGSLDDRDREISLMYKHGCGENEPKEIAPPADRPSRLQQLRVRIHGLGKVSERVAKRHDLDAALVDPFECLFDQFLRHFVCKRMRPDHTKRSLTRNLVEIRFDH